MLVWTEVVLAYWVVYFTTGKQDTPFILASVYSLFHILFDLIIYTPGTVYCLSCIVADFICFDLIGNYRNKSYLSIRLRELLLLSALLNLFGFIVYLAETNNILYDMPIVLLHGYIIYLLCGSNKHGHGYS